MIRQPIVVVLGHVDHGKTSILDAIRKTGVVANEPGAITQEIGASEVPLSVIKKISDPISDIMKVKFTIPGLLFIDTPGHAAFTNLRKRGGSIADLAVLVVDISQGFQPQTLEALEILKEYKTPFVIAANKLDLIPGWKDKPNEPFLKSLPMQREEAITALDEKVYTIAGEVSRFGFDSERFDRVKDFTKEIAIIPLSAKTGEGLPELLLFLSGLAQKFLEKKLETNEGPGKASILEVKFEKGLGTTIDILLYDGVMKKGDRIIFLTKGGVKSTKIRGLLKPKPLVEMKEAGIGEKYDFVDQVMAASGIKIFAPDLDDALPGSEALVVTPETEKELTKKLEKDIKDILFSSDKVGIVLRADTLGSVEAITRILNAEGIKVRRADIGPVTKSDILQAISTREMDRYHGAVLAFNVSVSTEFIEEARSNNVPVIQSNIIYSLLDQMVEWKEQEKQREKEEALKDYIFPAKVKFLTGHTFRASKPAVFGIEVLIGRIKQGYELVKEDGTSIGYIKTIKVDKDTQSEARTGDQVAISIPGSVIGRQIFEGETYYTKVPLKHSLILLDKYKTLLNGAEISLLEERQRLAFK